MWARTPTLAPSTMSAHERTRRVHFGKVCGETQGGLAEGGGDARRQRGVVRRRIGRGTPRSGRKDGRVHVRAGEDPDAHSPPYPEAPRGVQDGVRPVVEAKDGRHVAALDERAPPDKQLDVRDEEPRRKDMIVLKVAQAKAARDGGRENGSKRRSDWWSRLLWSE